MGIVEGIVEDWADWVDGRKREGRGAGWVRRRDGVYGCGGGPWTCGLSDQKVNSNDRQRHMRKVVFRVMIPSKGLRWPSLPPIRQIRKATQCALR